MGMPPSVAGARLATTPLQAMKNRASHRLTGRFPTNCCVKNTQFGRTKMVLGRAAISHFVTKTWQVIVICPPPLLKPKLDQTLRQYNYNECVERTDKQGNLVPQAAFWHYFDRQRGDNWPNRSSGTAHAAGSPCPYACAPLKRCARQPQPVGRAHFVRICSCR